MILESAQRNLKKSCKVCNGGIPESGSLILIIQLIWILREMLFNICLSLFFFFTIDIVIISHFPQTLVRSEVHHFLLGAMEKKEDREQ